MSAGVVASLHVHPKMAGDFMQSVPRITLEAEKGIVEDARYFARSNRSTGVPSKRQISVIEREQLSDHAAVLGLEGIAPGEARANIETNGINLQELIGQNVRIGGAILHIYQPRTPCEKMDRICQGLRTLMENGRQGVMAQVVQSGTIQVGDSIEELS